MVSLTRPIRYLSEELTVWRYRQGNYGLEGRAVEITKSRALSGVRKNPNGKTIEDALMYAHKEQVVAIVDKYLQTQIEFNQKQAAFYGARVEELNKKAKSNGGERAQVAIFGHAVDEYSRVQKINEELSQILNSQGLAAFAMHQERSKKGLGYNLNVKF